MNKKNLTLIMMLVAGLVTVVITYLMNYSIVAKLGILLAVLAVFYFIGTVIVNVIEHFEKQNQKRIEEEERAAKEAAEAALATDGNVEEKTK
ncbi:MAG: hypothetical protein MJ130_08700 [Lachnospiraceae bacterium]|nr:hypothetical protein [Lachnospiraceae bacterium]